MQNLIKLCKLGVPCLGKGKVFAHMAVGWHREAEVEPRFTPGGGQLFEGEGLDCSLPIQSDPDLIAILCNQNSIG